MTELPTLPEEWLRFTVADLEERLEEIMDLIDLTKVPIVIVDANGQDELVMMPYSRYEELESRRVVKPNSQV